MRKLPSFFTDDIASVREGSKGRSPQRIATRNKCLCDRFYFLQKQKHLHFAKIVEVLSDQFFLSQIEVTKILRRDQQQEYLGELRRNPPAVRELKTRWPWMNWD